MSDSLLERVSSGMSVADAAELTTYVADEMQTHYEGTGIDVVGGEYYGRNYGAVLAQTHVIVDRYASQNRSARPSVLLQACSEAANRRLRELHIGRRLTPDQLTDSLPVNPNGNRMGMSVSSEPLALYISRSKSPEAAREYIDDDPDTSFGAVDSFLNRAGRPELRLVLPIVDHLTRHPEIDKTRRLLLADAFAARRFSVGLLELPAKRPYLEDIDLTDA